MLLWLDERVVGRGAPVLLVADIGAQHGGDLARALALIDAAAAAGAGAVQIHPGSAGRRGQEALRSEWYARLRDRARRHGLVPLAVACSVERAALFAALGLPALVAGATALDAHEILHALGGFGRPIVLTTGGADPPRVGEALEALGGGAGTPARQPPVILLAGSADPAETPGVTSMAALAERFGELVGWQDARPGHVLAVGAAALGACVVMKAFTDRASAVTSDVALGPEDFRHMVAAVRELEASLGAAGLGSAHQRLSVAGPDLRADGAARLPRPQLGTGRGER